VAAAPAAVFQRGVPTPMGADRCDPAVPAVPCRRRRHACRPPDRRHRGRAQTSVAGRFNRRRPHVSTRSLHTLLILLRTFTGNTALPR
jgi:hypothetical protein